MRNYLLDSELRDFEKQFNLIVNRTHKDSITVFDDMLTFIITAFNPEPKPNPYWQYKPEENMLFQGLMIEWLKVLQRMIDVRGWYDVFGDFFMMNVGKTSQQYRGQFFTPHTVCDFMAKVALDDRDEKTEPRVRCGAFGKRVVVNDCACGSARLLLAAHTVNCERGHRPCYYVAEDVDRLCCKMAAINMCAHGCFGEVICHNSLTEPHKANFGFIINEGLYPFPAVPTIRYFDDDPLRFVSVRAGMDLLAEISQKQSKSIEMPVAVKKQAPKQAKVPEQLTLNFFD